MNIPGPLCHPENILLLKLSGLWFNMKNGCWKIQVYPFFKMLSMWLVNNVERQKKKKEKERKMSLRSLSKRLEAKADGKFGGLRR